MILHCSHKLTARLPFGYASSFGHAQGVPLNILIETIQVLVIYPLFVQSTRHLIKLRTLEPFIMRIHHAAQSGGGVRKFGIAGLFVFVFAPFWNSNRPTGRIGVPCLFSIHEIRILTKVS